MTIQKLKKTKNKTQTIYPILPTKKQKTTTYRVSRKTGTVGELGRPCFSQTWSYLPDKVVPIARMAKFCRTIGTTLSDNWNHLVGQ